MAPSSHVFHSGRLDYIYPDQVSKAGEKILVEETEEDGKETVIFSTNHPCLRVTHSKSKSKTHPIAWSKIRRCADGAIIEFKDKKTLLHIVELKKHVNRGKWKKAKEQFEGMLVNVLALGGALGLGEFSEVIAYVAFQRDDLTATETSSTISLKSETGTGRRLLPEGDDWREGVVDLLHFEKVSLVKIQLDGKAHATHPL